MHGMQEVTGSIPVFSTNLSTPQKMLCGVFFVYMQKSPGRFAHRDIACSLRYWLQPWPTVKMAISPAFSIPLKTKRTHCRLDPAKQCVRFFARSIRAKIAVSFYAEFSYFKKPFTICSSASFSFKPKVISLISCSPAILPIAASWIRLASTQLAES